jgi:hypothetical protein
MDQSHESCTDSQNKYLFDLQNISRENLLIREKLAMLENQCFKLDSNKNIYSSLAQRINDINSTA